VPCVGEEPGTSHSLLTGTQISFQLASDTMSITNLTGGGMDTQVQSMNQQRIICFRKVMGSAFSGVEIMAKDAHRMLDLSWLLPGSETPVEVLE
jgi:hypothetical protein